MTNRFALFLSACAFAISLAGTPIGSAAGDLVDAVVPRAKRADFAVKAGFAKKAGTAANATAVGGIRATRAPRAGNLVPLGSDGKFPVSVGAIGPEGPAGPAGPTGAQGPPGVAGLQLVTATSSVDTVAELKSVTASCPSGKKVVGGGAEAVSSTIDIEGSKPTADLTGWIGQGRGPGGGAFYGVRAYALCATVSG